MMGTTTRQEKITTEDIIQAITQWEESVKWITHGWDCEDEYWNDLSYREKLQELIVRFGGDMPFSIKLRKRIIRADEKFKQVTVKSRLCISDTSAKTGVLNGHFAMHCDAYDPDQYWYYYRWPLDCPDVYRKYDVVEFQRNCCGLDFEKITEAELRKAVGELVSAMYEMMGMPKQPLQGKKNVEDPSS